MSVFPPSNLNKLVKGVVSEIGGGVLKQFLSTPTSQTGGSSGRLNHIDSGNTLVRSSHQASRIYDVAGPGAVRPRGLFYVVFRRAAAPENWQRDVGFLVKSLDQPKVQPKAEELNQYNKKRQIYTGYDLSPVNMTIYDTADSTVTQMWSQYSKFFFGDFHQQEAAYVFDQLDQKMNGEDIGYGLILPDDTETDERNSQFFFTAIDIYKVFANEYTKTTLVNPRITSFDPDDLDYSQMEALTFRLSFAYEAVLYENDGSPLPISNDPHIEEIFGDPRGDADMIDVEGPIRHSTASLATGGVEGIPAGLFQSQTSGGILTPTGSPRSGIGGVLGAFGSFDFGTLAGVAVNSVVSGRGLKGAELVYAATGNPSLSNIVGMVQTKRPAGEIASRLLSGARSSTTGINSTLVDSAQAVIASKAGNKYVAGKLAGQVVSGIIGSASISNTGVTQQVSKTSGGLKLASPAINLVNAQRSKGSQLGFKLPNPFKKI